MATRGTILVADDEALARQGIAELLQDEGYQVHQAEDGTVALRRLDEVDVDVVLTDLRMPGADGLEVLRKVRDVCPQTMVMMMTAYASVETVVDALTRPRPAPDGQSQRRRAGVREKSH